MGNTDGMEALRRGGSIVRNGMGIGEWSFSEAWNEATATFTDRPREKRSHLWASELGKAPVDIWLAMRGAEPSNPMNHRARRKGEAGKLFEWLASLVLQRGGLLRQAQPRAEHQYPGLLRVTGYCDFIAGGLRVDTGGLAMLETFGLPESFMRGAKALAALWEGKELSERPLEIKSCSASMFERYEKNGAASDNHRLQLFHYLKSLGYPRGDVVYICREDLRLIELPVLNPSATEDAYKAHIEKITRYHEANEQPPLESEIVWELGRFTKNWRIEYSAFLHMLYGYKEPADFADRQKPIVDRWNRALTRLKDIRDGKTTPTGKPIVLTDKNKAALDEIRAGGWEPERLIADFAGEAEESEEA